MATVEKEVSEFSKEDWKEWTLLPETRGYLRILEALHLESTQLYSIDKEDVLKHIHVTQGIGSGLQTAISAIYTLKEEK